MLVTPALPWPTGDGGGIIKLSRRVTEQDLIDGILKITLDNAGREYNASIVRYQDNTLRVVADNDVFTIDPIPQTSDTLTLTRLQDSAAQAYSLVNVELAQKRLAEVFADEDCTQRPQVGIQYDKLYVRVNKPMTDGNTVKFNAEGSMFQKLTLGASSAFGEGYYIILYAAFYEWNLEDGYEGVIAVEPNAPLTIESPLQLDFGWLFE